MALGYDTPAALHQQWGLVVAGLKGRNAAKATSPKTKNWFCSTLDAVACRAYMTPLIPATLLLTAVLLPPVAAAQGAPALAQPIDCRIGATCIVQNYVDHDPGAGARDYRCGFLSYDGHKGTDIRVVDTRAYRQGVAVLAAAPGRVRAVRDAMPDANMRALGKAAVAGREAGNSVVIEHGEGWETQYAHMRRGSLAVRVGDSVHRGQKLGLVGLSGHTEFPHLHFEVRRLGKIVDPFVGAGEAAPCEPGRDPLWQQQALLALEYTATGVLDADISGAPPARADGNVDREMTAGFTPESKAVVFWVQIYGAQADDLEEMRLLAPDGGVLAERRDRIERNRAQQLTYVGTRHRGAVLPAGTYRGEYTLYRGEKQEKVVSLVREVRLDAGVAGR